MTHSPEPWEVAYFPASKDLGDDPGYSLRDANGKWVLDDDMYETCSPDITKVDLERIVACVNELAGVPDDVLKSGAIGELITRLLRRSSPGMRVGYLDILLIRAFHETLLLSEKEKPGEIRTPREIKATCEEPSRIASTLCSLKAVYTPEELDELVEMIRRS